MIPRMLLNIRRPIIGSRVNGRWIPSGFTTPIEFKASVQPTKPAEREPLPEGNREAGESYKLYSNNQPVLYTVKTNERPDIVEIYGEDFEIFSSEHWKNGIINHSKYIVTKVKTK